jgi:hypothetical protein
MVPKPLELFYRKNSEIFEEADQKKLRSYKQSLMDDFGENLEAGSKDCAHEISDGNEDCIGNWIRGHLCYIADKELGYFLLMT